MMNDEGGDSSNPRYPTFVLLKNSNLLADPLMEKARSTTFDNQLIELESVDSTNNYAMGLIHAGMASEGTVILARYQSAGKGQRGKSWHSEAGQNLIMSLILEPGALILPKPFLLSAAISLGILETVRGPEEKNWRIKWPNDIYWNDRKAAGILIESVIQGADWPFAVAGIGMNLNQESFPPDLPYAISLKQITGRKYEARSVARDMVPRIQNQIALLRKDPEKILESFNQALYQAGKPIAVKKGSEVLITDLKGVDAQGLLITGDGAFKWGEVEWMVGR